MRWMCCRSKLRHLELKTEQTVNNLHKAHPGRAMSLPYDIHGVLLNQINHYVQI